MDKNISKHFVINSTKEFFLFQLDRSGCLSYKILDKNLNQIDKHIIRKNDALKFDISLDINNNINLIYLLKNGELHFNIYKETTWINSIIGKFDTASNKYSLLETLNIDDSLNIIYSYANLINSNIYTLHHIRFKNNSSEKHSITKFVSNEPIKPFSIHYDRSGTIHLLYNTISRNGSHIFYSYYSPYIKKWNINPKDLSHKNNHIMSPYIFIDSKSNIHGVWVEKDKSNYHLKYIRMSTIGKEKYIWNSIEVPYVLSQESYPIIYEENNKLNISYYNNKVIYNIVSYDYGLSWSEDNRINVNADISLIPVTLNSSLYPNIKLNHTFLCEDLDREIYLIKSLINNDAINPVFNSKEQATTSSENDSDSLKYVNKDLSVNQETISIDTNELLEKIQEIQASQRELKSELNKIIKSEEIILNIIKNIQTSLEDNKSSFFEKLFNRN